MSNEKRKAVDCRLYPSEKGCTLRIEGTEEEGTEEEEASDEAEAEASVE